MKMSVVAFRKMEVVAKELISIKKYTGHFKEMIDRNFELKELEVIG